MENVDIRQQLPFEPGEVSKKLLAWYDKHGRDLPWRQTRDPYRIWLSEIMLQQTTVGAVIPYYERFLGAFPDVGALAEAPLESVLELWSGLGYYSRARNLHRAARHVVAAFQGRFPESVAELMQLPGVGRSTAGAIVSIAHDRPAPILDGNVRRVLARLTALRQPPRDREAEKQLWMWADLLTPAKRAHDYAQAIMDLGATVCVPRIPACDGCPLSGLCAAREAGLQNELPLAQKRGAVPVRHQLIVIVDRNGQLLLRRRPPTGLLGGMWEFPCVEISDPEKPDGILREMLSSLPTWKAPKRLGRIRHAYSHFRLEAEVYRVTADPAAGVADGETFWHDADGLATRPLHGAHQKALALIMKGMGDD